MNLIDTNVFLEIILDQKKRENCERFLEDTAEALFISDFALHSIGVILFRNGKEDGFQAFVDDMLDSLKVVSLPEAEYSGLRETKRKYGLDFDDAYQFSVAKVFGLRIVTMDNDFRAIKDEMEVVFL